MKQKAASTWIRRASLAMSASLMIMFFSATALRAQLDTGTILGTVTDTSGAAIRGANVTLTNTDLCFIDGGHSYECIKADTETALKILSPNGVIVWDDFSWFTEGVSQYLKELRNTLPLYRIAGSQLVIYNRNRERDTQSS